MFPQAKSRLGELPIEAVKRELFEETGIPAEVSQIHSLGSLYIRKPLIQYIYHLFRVEIKGQRPDIRLSSEHRDFCWAHEKDFGSMPLRAGAREALRRYRSYLNKTKGASVNAYLFLRKQEEMLLHLRKNTGYCDGMWGLVAGHVEEGEPATAAIAREAFEEAGITIDPRKLRPVHIMHRQTNRMNVDLFFECSHWEGEIVNCEPHKCERLAFFPIHALPTNMFEYCKFAWDAASQGEWYSELGWTD